MYVYDFTKQFELTWHRDIRPKKRTVCFDVSTSDNHAPVVLWSCHGMQGNQEWKYNYVSWSYCFTCQMFFTEIVNSQAEAVCKFGNYSKFTILIETSVTLCWGSFLLLNLLNNYSITTLLYNLLSFRKNYSCSIQ